MLHLHRPLTTRLALPRPAPATLLSTIRLPSPSSSSSPSRFSTARTLLASTQQKQPDISPSNYTHPPPPPPPRSRTSSRIHSRSTGSQLPVLPLVAIFVLGTVAFYQLAKSRDGQGQSHYVLPTRDTKANREDIYQTASTKRP